MTTNRRVKQESCERNAVDAIISGTGDGARPKRRIMADSSWSGTGLTRSLLLLGGDVVEPTCDLRITGDDGQHQCIAAGGLLLSIMAPPGETAERVCLSCSIPGEIARRPCLYQVPIRLFREGGWRSYFPCRWFYKLDVILGRLPDSVFFCLGCFYWFPRPRIELMKDYLQVTRHMMNCFQKPGSQPTKTIKADERVAPGVTRLPSWRRLLQGLPIRLRR